MKIDAATFAAIERRYAEMVEGSIVEVKFQSDWFCIYRKWSDEFNCSPIELCRKRSLINAENLAQEFDELDQRASA